MGRGAVSWLVVCVEFLGGARRGGGGKLLILGA